jgi:glycosyltransferase involved in cell wall biosynthesis
MKLSAIVLTKNSEKTLLRCLKSIGFADEILIIDDNSTDSSVAIAKEQNAKVYKRELIENFAAQRNFGLEKAKGEWVLFVDSDEEVSVYLKNEIIQAINNPLRNYQAYKISRRDIFWGKELRATEAGKIKLIRLAKKSSGKWIRAVHETWRTIGNKKELRGALYHFAHPNLSEFISSVNKYSSLHAETLQKEGKKSTFFKIIFFPVGKFFKNWLILGGAGEGSRGFIVSLVMSIHSFLAWSKLWIMQKK